jgi:hypothetical protein
MTKYNEQVRNIAASDRQGSDISKPRIVGCEANGCPMRAPASPDQAFAFCGFHEQGKLFHSKIPLQHITTAIRHNIEDLRTYSKLVKWEPNHKRPGHYVQMLKTLEEHPRYPMGADESFSMYLMRMYAGIEAKIFADAEELGGGAEVEPDASRRTSSEKLAQMFREAGLTA